MEEKWKKRNSERMEVKRKRKNREAEIKRLETHTHKHGHTQRWTYISLSRLRHACLKKGKRCCSIWRISKVWTILRNFKQVLPPSRQNKLVGRMSQHSWYIFHQDLSISNIHVGSLNNAQILTKDVPDSSYQTFSPFKVTFVVPPRLQDLANPLLIAKQRNSSLQRLQMAAERVFHRQLGIQTH